MTAKDLKNALLQEAVQGKLVPQIASEGNARDLLEEIRKEKSKLVKDGKLKKEKPLPEITEEDIPFDIPENWCWCRIGEIFNLQAGKTISSSEISEISNGNDYLCYGGNGIRGYVKNYNREGYYPLIGRQGALCGNVNFANGKFYATEHAVVVDTYANTNVDWAGLFLKALNLNQYATATAQPGLAVRNINEVAIPLPPLAEQKRIVTAIEKFIPLIEEYGKKETELKAFNEQIGTLTKKAILQEAVQGKLVPQIAAEGNAKDLLEEIKKEKAKVAGKASSTSFASKTCAKEFPPITDDEIPFDIPESWCWCRLGEITEITMGQSPEGINVGETVQGMEFHQGKIFFTDKIIGKSNQQTSEITKVAKENSILLCMRAPVGKINITDRKICIGRGLSSIIPFFNVDTMFLYYLLETLESDFNKKATGSTFKAITGDIVRNQAIPLPPLAEQKRIVAAIEKMLPLCEKLGE